MGRDPEFMTPEERMRRVIELMAIALIRFQAEKKEEKVRQGVEVGSDSDLTAKDPRDRKRKGPLPFGYKWTKYGYAVNEVEQGLIQRVKELAAQGLSSEKIAKHLNEFDKESKRAGKWRRTTVWRILRTGGKNSQNK